jgi:hypothetical protein
MDLVERTLDRFAQDLRQVLGGQLVEVVIHGSYVLGDFRPNRGDLDYIVVTNADLGKAANARLFDLHDGYRSAKALLLHQLEGTFYPQDFLATLAPPFVGCYIGTTRRGWRTISTLQNSYIDLRLAGQCGRRLLGTAVPLYQPSEADILREQRATLADQLAAADGTGELSLGHWMSAAHWCARTLCHRATGRVVSKLEACRWARTVVPRDDLRKLLDLAEGMRYPYGTEPAEDWVEAACRKLLSQVGGTLPEAAGEGPWPGRRP